ncbi:MAG: indolepyruvate ferredoxin oxidoreductase subunit alpha [Candidatus Lokiarchaeia archaeon]
MPTIKELISREKGKKVVMLGNEAMARGALEAGIGFASTYPGTPASEVGDAIAAIAEQLPGLVFQYSTNEYVALENAMGASWAGVRSLCTFKMVGMNVAADPMFTLAYSGVTPTGGLVIINGGDPAALSSTNEQDNRYYGLHARIPVVEPSSTQESKDFVVEAFNISEKYDVPVIINSTARACHAVGAVELGELRDPPKEGHFEKNWGKYYNTLVLAVQNHLKLINNQNQMIAEYAPTTKLNKILPGDNKTGIITSGMSYDYTLEALDNLGIYDVPILKLGLVYPLSPKQITDFASNLEQLIIMEELDPFLEGEVKKIAYDQGLEIPIRGKELFPSVGELNTDLAIQAYAKVFNKTPPIDTSDLDMKVLGAALILPMRTPNMCPGCPHRATYYAIKKAVEDKGYDVVWANDIGCYAMGALAPFNMGDLMTCMSAGESIAAGMSYKAKNQKMVAFIGDSTFLHTGFPGLLNAVWNDADLLLVIMDNRWTAMTGHQPTPASGVNWSGKKAKSVNLRDIVSALGVDYVRVADPYNVKNAIAIFEDAMKQKGVRVVISQQECILETRRRARSTIEARKEKGIRQYIDINEDACIFCEECIKEFGCPAITVTEFEGEKVAQIELSRCVECMVCKQMCKGCAVSVTKVWPGTTILEEGGK